MPSAPTIIFGVESTCDETSCAVVVDGRKVLSNVVATQIALHERFGGVVPEVASRAHLEAVNTVIAQALEQAGVRPEDFSAVAVAHQPGLIGSLLIGLMAAKTLAWVWDKPLVGVNHIHAHAYAAALDAEPIEYPAVALIASGGHTSLYRCRSEMEMELLGSTTDDAAGEAFDKVAAILHLPYPGGPNIDKIARQGNPRAVAFPRALLKGQSLDFSFSGLKTAVLYHVRGTPGATGRATARGGEIAVEYISADGRVLSADEARAAGLVQHPDEAAILRRIAKSPWHREHVLVQYRDEIVRSLDAVGADELQRQLRGAYEQEDLRHFRVGGFTACEHGARKCIIGLYRLPPGAPRASRLVEEIAHIHAWIIRQTDPGLWQEVIRWYNTPEVSAEFADIDEAVAQTFTLELVERGGTTLPAPIFDAIWEMFDGRRIPADAMFPPSTAAPTGPGHGVENLTPQEIADIAASFQAAVVDTLRIKIRRAVQVCSAKSILIGGGVSANSALRAGVLELGRKLRLPVRMPELKYCVDNAAMTAGLAYHYLRAGQIADLNLDAAATVRR